MAIERVETLVIGGGQAGLAMSYRLKQRYFLGLQWLSKMSSSFLSGIGDDAAALADHIACARQRCG